MIEAPASHPARRTNFATGYAATGGLLVEVLNQLLARGG
jgi:hypothetical protein